MIELLTWIFTSFWRFAGVIILLCVALDGLTGVARALRGPARPQLPTRTP